MKKPATIKYAEGDIKLLSGKIRASTYMKEVQAVLNRRGIVKSDNYVSQVVTGQFYYEPVWDAVVEVLNARKIEKQVRSALVAQAVVD
ncbi:hypothetical protein [Spirosoma radiotolerans]|uniref:Uncharacterized protein n=1 Tax=Spirosoma radiotolerans TaxID=1379870 RepID=A0A0E3ZUA5_9BACT|nr:hypothetical protein [Spirosoma radiotolerans]AKD55060.1 hypothetical protein SD10_09215 [Spirosoma radiotolerans]